MVMVAAESTELCAASGPSWHVDHKDGHDTPSSSDPDYGDIIYDQGEGSIIGNDPFKEDNW